MELDTETGVTPGTAHEWRVRKWVSPATNWESDARSIAMFSTTSRRLSRNTASTSAAGRLMNRADKPETRRSNCDSALRSCASRGTTAAPGSEEMASGLIILSIDCESDGSVSASAMVATGRIGLAKYNLHCLVASASSGERRCGRFDNSVWLWR
ncbi:MAG: hypothetical protein IT521_01405 [Burkholderiales bacterium]|nr:hypothetical protein [Burkholderiales bacterium]